MQLRMCLRLTHGMLQSQHAQVHIIILSSTYYLYGISIHILPSSAWVSFMLPSFLFFFFKSDLGGAAIV